MGHPHTASLPGESSRFHRAARGRIVVALGALVAAALGLRLWGAWCAALVFDERAHWALAETISFQPGRWHLVSRTLDHPPLSIYVLKLGSLLFGTSDFDLRLPYVLAGAATLVPLYFLARRAFSPTAGLWAAAFLALDQFHAGWSRVFMPEVLMLLLGTLALLQFLRALERGTVGSYALLGALLGLAYLAKEPALLLLPAFWIYLLITPEHRHVLARPQWYLAHAVLLLVIAPDLIWNASQWSESYLARDAAMIAERFHLSLKSVSLYAGEILRWTIGSDVLDTDYEQGNLYVCHWPAGLLYLAAIAAAAVRWWRRPAVRLLAVVFCLVFAAFLLAPGGTLFEPFWWASLSLIPAVVCLGGWIAQAGRARWPILAAALLLVAYLGAHEIGVLRRVGQPEPRVTVEQFAADFIYRGNQALAAGQLDEAQRRYIYALNIGGPREGAYVGLARIAQDRGQTAKARRLMDKCFPK